MCVCMHTHPGNENLTHKITHARNNGDNFFSFKFSDNIHCFSRISNRIHSCSVAFTASKGNVISIAVVVILRSHKMFTIVFDSSQYEWFTSKCFLFFSIFSFKHAQILDLTKTKYGVFDSYVIYVLLVIFLFRSFSSSNTLFTLLNYCYYYDALRLFLLFFSLSQFSVFVECSFFRVTNVVFTFFFIYSNVNLHARINTSCYTI